MLQRFVPVDNELNAIVEFDKTFPFLLSKDNLKEYENGFVNWHKQTTIEISFVIEGAVDVYVLSEKTTVKEGNGFFIMPGTLHSVAQTPNTSSAVYFTSLNQKYYMAKREAFLIVNTMRPLFNQELHSLRSLQSRNGPPRFFRLQKN